MSETKCNYRVIVTSGLLPGEPRSREIQFCPLHAAAPELLQAGKLLRQELDRYSGDWETSIQRFRDASLAELVKLDAAIAHAEGRKP